MSRHLADHPMLPVPALRAIDGITESLRAGELFVLLHAYDAGGEVDGNLEGIPVRDPRSQRGSCFTGLCDLGWLRPQTMRRGDEFVVVRVPATGEKSHSRGGGVGVYDLTVRGHSVARAWRDAHGAGYPEATEVPPSSGLEQPLF